MLRSGYVFSNFTRRKGMTGRVSVSGEVGAVLRLGEFDSVEMLTETEDTDLSDLVGEDGIVDVVNGIVLGEISSEYFR